MPLANRVPPSAIQYGVIALLITCLLWLAAFAAEGDAATSAPVSGWQQVGMQLHESGDQGLANSIGLPPASHWRFSVEQGRRLEKEPDGERYQMVLAWFQLDILGVLSGLLLFIPLLYVRRSSGHPDALHQRQLFGHYLQFRFCHGD